MNAYRRNVMLGATVIVGLAVLGWMILKFGGNVAQIWGPETILVKFVTNRADGVADGSPILYRGVDSGHVTRVWIDEETKQKVYFEATINREPALPANVKGVIRTASLLGAGSSITLETRDGVSSESLKDGQLVEAEFVGLGDILPSEFGELAGEMTKTVKEFRESGIIKNIDAQVQNAGRLIDSMHELVGDPNTQTDLKTSIANLREVTESAKTIATKLDRFADDLQKTSTQASETMTDARTQVTRAGDNIESLSRQMGDRLTQIAKLLDQFQSVAEKVNNGQGTAGALVNDPKLYQSLVDTSRELNLTIKDLKRLVQQWEQEGVTLKLK
ncbi:hypothetical protein BH09PLA1_BH09PLA1_09050 [soil metagenome]